MDLLSEELKSQLGEGDVVYVKKKKKTVREPVKSTDLSVKERKRELLRKKQEKAAKRSSLMKSLQKMSKEYSQDEKRLFQSSKCFSEKKTLKKKLKQAFLEEKIGISVSDSDKLYKQKEIYESNAGKPIQFTQNTLKPKVFREKRKKVVTCLLNEIPKTEETQTSKKPKMPQNEETPKIPQTEETQTKNSRAAEKLEYSFSDDEAEAAVTLFAPRSTVPKPKKPKKPITRPELKKFYAVIPRSQEAEESRAKLPIINEETDIVSAIESNNAIILSSSTGSGKSTQLPQFLYEAGYSFTEAGRPGKIGITQPRRVAVKALCDRLRWETGLPAETIGFQVRYERQVHDDTRIKVMTDGILLREIEKDFMLFDYSVVIIDEAHERNLNTDLLIGLLSRAVVIRNKKHPETPLRLVIMSATLNTDDFRSTRLFNPLPPLLELESRQFPVVVHFARKTSLRESYISDMCDKIGRIHYTLPKGAILAFCPGQREINMLCGLLEAKFAEDTQLAEFTPVKTVVLPLYANLPPHLQKRVFERVDSSETRVVIVATNIAESSLTIPDIVYVVDSGLEKRVVHSSSTGFSFTEIGWVSKASALQRSGRCGRVCEGHSYRMYSSTVFHNEFIEHSCPEILRAPLEDTILRMATLGIRDVTRFPFPTSPDRNDVSSALKVLKELNAIDSNGITRIGRTLSRFPVSPRYARMITLAGGSNCLGHVIAIVAALSVENIFADGQNNFRRKWRDKNSDFLAILNVMLKFDHAEHPEQFCEVNGLKYKSLIETGKLRKQLWSIAVEISGNTLESELKLGVPSKAQRSVICQIIAMSFLGNLARKCEVDPDMKERRSDYTTLSGRTVRIHPSSGLFVKESQPQFAVYSMLKTHEHTENCYMINVTRVDYEWLYEASKNTSLCEHSAPLDQPLPVYNSEIDALECYVRAEIRSGESSVTVKLPAQKIEFPEDQLRDRWFARLLMEGKIISEFEEFRPYWKVRPSSVISGYGSMFVERLRREKVSSKGSLVKKWYVFVTETELTFRESDSSFLLNDLMELIQRSKVAMFRQRFNEIVSSFKSN